MTISFRCTCGQSLEAEDEHAGLETRCPYCGMALEIPYGESPSRNDSRPFYSFPSKCPICSSPMEDDALVCVNCGFNRKTGQKIKTSGIPGAKQGERVEEEIPEKFPILSSFAKSFSFPLKGAALWMVILMPVLNVIFAIGKAIPLLGIIAGAVYFGFYYSCLIDILRTAAGGPRFHVEWPDFRSDILEEMIIPAFIVCLAGFIVIVLPLMATLTLVGGTAAISALSDFSNFRAEILPGLAGGAIILGIITIVCASYLPMTLIVSGIYRNLAASLNPVALFRSASRIPGEYALVTIFVYIMLALPYFLRSGLAALPLSGTQTLPGSGGILAALLWPSIRFYFFAVIASRLGFMVYYNKERLGI